MAEVVAFPAVRAWGDEFSPVLQESLVQSVDQALRAHPKGWADAEGYLNILAISGGGPNGAFGAGLLNGWSASGTRPTFKLVTGVSAGALIAPFAFLGPEHDNTLKMLCTELVRKDIITLRPVVSVLSGHRPIADITPLARLLAKLMDERFLSAVGRAHQQGRRLLVGTFNLDARRLVIWDMGAIASSGKPGALELFRNVILASASIPVAFRPVYMPVEADGAQYDEMHVDGGVTAQVLFHSPTLDIRAAMEQAGMKEPPRLRIYILRNSQFRAEYEPVEPKLLPIATRSLLSLTTADGFGDLYRIYAFSQRDGIDFNLIAIPSDYERRSKEQVDPEEMRRLFGVGLQEARSGIRWQKHPPGFPR
jgi:patatin-like phospholipase